MMPRSILKLAVVSGNHNEATAVHSSSQTESNCNQAINSVQAALPPLCPAQCVLWCRFDCPIGQCYSTVLRYYCCQQSPCYFCDELLVDSTKCQPLSDSRSACTTSTAMVVHSSCNHNQSQLGRHVVASNITKRVM
jgi:hypothetical protein